MADRHTGWTLFCFGKAITDTDRRSIRTFSKAFVYNARPSNFRLILRVPVLSMTMKRKYINYPIGQRIIDGHLDTVTDKKKKNN